MPPPLPFAGTLHPGSAAGAGSPHLVSAGISAGDLAAARGADASDLPRLPREGQDRPQKPRHRRLLGNAHQGGNCLPANDTEKL